MQDKQNIDIHDLLAERKQIAIIWTVEDVQQVRPDLSDEEAWIVLRQAKRHHDANWGICRYTLEYWARQLFGPAQETIET